MLYWMGIVTRYKRGSTARGPVSSAELHALVQFRYRIRRFLHFSEQAARSAGLEPQQYQMMLAIRGMQPEVQPSIRNIAERLQIQHHSAVELVDRSVARSLVRRSRSDADRRQVLVELTPKGERLLRELAAHHRDALSEQAPALVESLTTLMQSVAARGHGSRHESGGSGGVVRRRPPAPRRKAAED